MANPNVLVLGAGVMGLTTAVTLTEAGHRVTVVADEIPGRTSLAAGASWGPYHVEPHEKVSSWGTHTLTALTELAEVPGSSVRLVTGIEASRVAATMPDWAGNLPDVKECRTGDLPPGFRIGWRYTVPVVDMPRYLGYLLGRLRAADGRIDQRHVTDLADLGERGPVVVNCAGLGAHHLAGDDSIYPIRGQLVVVSNPGIDTFFSEDTGLSPNLTHYLPQGDHVVLGGVAVPDDWSREADPAIAASIITRCGEIEPLLRTATVLEHRTGLRPTRAQVRLEAQRRGDGVVIHNYGHGGAGVSLSWGCAAEVRELVSAV